MDDQQRQQDQLHNELADNKNIPINQKEIKWRKFFIPLFIANIVPVILITLDVLSEFHNGFELSVLLFFARIFYFVPLAFINIASIVFYLYKQRPKNLSVIILSCFGLFFSAYLLSFIFPLLLDLNMVVGVVFITISVIYFASLLIRS